MKTIFFLLGITVVTLYGCNNHKVQAAESNGGFVLTPAMKQLIRIDTVRLTPIADELKLSGEISFDENTVVKVYPSVSGVITETKVSLGDKVVKGQPLAIMRSADMAGNFSDLTSAAADVAIAKRNLDNEQLLYSKGIASDRELTEAQNNYNKALAAKEKIAALININGFGHAGEGGRMVITAPVDGYIVEKKVNSNAFIRADMGDNLFTISNLKDVWVYANVYEADIARVKTGYHAALAVLAYPNRVFHTTVNEISNVLDSNNVERVRLKLANPDMLLKPSMFCNITIYNETGGKANAIPAGSVVFDNSRNYVLVYKNDHAVAIREVELLKKVDDIAYIRSGLEPGEAVISQKGLLIFNALQQKN